MKVSARPPVCRSPGLSRMFSGAFLSRTALFLGALLISLVSGTLVPTRLSAAPAQVLRLADFPSLTPGRFGSMGALASSGDWLAAGCHTLILEDDREGTAFPYGGRVLLWKRVDGLWQPRQVLQSPGPMPRPGDGFGTQLAMDGKRLLVTSAQYHGQTYAFVLMGDTWVFDGRLAKPGADPEFIAGNNSIALSGDIAVIGVGNGRVKQKIIGFVDVFQRQASGWAHKARLRNTHPLIGPTTTTNLPWGIGKYVAASGTTIYASIGAPSLVVFDKKGSTWAKSRDLHVATYMDGGYAYAAVSGHHLLLMSPSGFVEITPARDYDTVSTLKGNVLTILGNTLLAGDQIGTLNPILKLHQRQPDHVWAVSRTLTQEDHSLRVLNGALLTETDLLLLGRLPGSGPAGIGPQQLSVISRTPATTAASHIQIDHAGVVHARVVHQPAGTTRLELGDIIAGKDVKGALTLTAYQAGSQPVTLAIASSGDTSQFTLSATSLTLQPRGKATLSLDLKTATPGEKHLTLTFTPQGASTPIATYELVTTVVPAVDAADVSFIEQPVSGLYDPMFCRTLTGRAHGPGPITYRWLKNGKPIPGATTTRYLPTTGGSYQLEATHPRGKLLSTTAHIGFVHIPVSDLIVKPGSSAKCSISLSGPGITVEWLNRDDVSLKNMPGFTGADTPTLTVKEVPAFPARQTYAASVTMRPDPETEEFYTASLGVFIYPILLPPVLGELDSSSTCKLGQMLYINAVVADGYTGPRYNFPFFSFSGLPPGMQTDPFQGTAFGRPTAAGTYNVRITFTVDTFSVSKSYPITVLPDGPTPGLYWGDLQLKDTFPDDPEVGSVSLNVATGGQGAFSGTLMLGATSRTSMAGILAKEPYHTTPEKPFPLKFGGQAYVYWLASVAADADSYRLVIRRADLPGGNPLDTYTIGTLSLVKPHDIPVPEEHLGTYNLGLLSDGDDPTLLGHGWGTAKVTASGSVTLAGQLPDGSTITGSSIISPTDLRVYLHYGSGQTRSVLYGRGTIGGGGGGGGFLIWERPGTGKGRAYPDGISDRLLQLLSSRHTPVKDTPLLDHAQQQIVFSAPEGGIPSVPITLTPKHTVQFGTGTEANPIAAKLTIAPATGLITGSFVLKNPDPARPAKTLTRTIPYKGILLQEHGIGLGCFQIPSLPDPEAQPPTKSTTSPILSGNIQIRPPQQ